LGIFLQWSNNTLSVAPDLRRRSSQNLLAQYQAGDHDGNDLMRRQEEAVTMEREENVKRLKLENEQRCVQIEKERLEIERERLEIEKQKLELEKLKRELGSR
jgi:hypothetical protein